MHLRVYGQVRSNLFGGKSDGPIYVCSNPFKKVYCVRETEILEEQQPPQGVFICDHAGLVISESSIWSCSVCCNLGQVVLILSVFLFAGVPRS